MSFSLIPEEYKDCCSRIIEYLYIGDRKAAKSLELLEQLGITHIVNVTPPKNQGGVHNFFENDERFSYLRLPVVDSDVEDISPYFRTGVDFIHHARKQGHSVLVHCQQGISRSATIVIAYLMCYYQQLPDNNNNNNNSNSNGGTTPTMNLKSAYTLLKTMRPSVKPKGNFLKQLLVFGQQLQKQQQSQSQSNIQQPLLKSTQTTATNIHEYKDSVDVMSTQQTTLIAKNNKKRPLEDKDDSLENEAYHKSKNALKRQYTSHYFSSLCFQNTIRDTNDYDVTNDSEPVTVNVVCSTQAT